MLCHESRYNVKLPVPTTSITHDENTLLFDLFEGNIKEEEYLRAQQEKENYIVIRSKRPRRALQCDICGHVHRGNHFQKHASSKALHGKYKDAAPLNHNDALAVPRKPFFGTSRGPADDYMYRSNDPRVSFFSLNIVRDYLLHLIVIERKKIQRQWWPLATQAVFNYEIVHGHIKELGACNEPASETQLRNLVMFYYDKAADAPNPSCATLDPVTLKPKKTDEQLRHEN